MNKTTNTHFCTSHSQKYLGRMQGSPITNLLVLAHLKVSISTEQHYARVLVCVCVCMCVCVCVYVCVAALWREFLVLPFHVQQHVCVSQLRASLSLIRPYLPVRQHNKRIFKEDISLFHGAELLHWYCFNAERSSVCACACVLCLFSSFRLISFVHIYESL